MEDMILLLLFTYPGSVVEWVYGFLCKPYDYYTPLEGVQQAARYFVLSVICTSLSMLMLPFFFPNKIQFTISSVINALKNTEMILIYIPLSIAVSILLGGILFVFRHFVVTPICNSVARKKNKYTDSGLKDVWAELFNHPKDFDLWKCAMILKKNGKIIGCGMPYSMHVKKRNVEYSLMYCDIVLKEIKKGNNSDLIENHVLTYYDAQNDLVCEFWKADGILEYMKN